MFLIILLLVLFFVLMFTGMPIAIAIGASSIITLLAQGNLPAIIAPQRIFVMLDSFSMMAVPLFILAGEVMTKGGITQKLVKFASTMVGHIKGSQAQVTIVSSMLMAGVSGSASADCSAIGSILVPAMLDEGYDKDYSVAVLASASTIGPIIPPSIMMVIYGSMTSVSVGQMFVGGIIPGLMFGFSLMGLSYYYAAKRGYPVHKRATRAEKLTALREAFWALLMPVIILGGLLTGVFTPTEAGAVACLYAFIVGFCTKNIKISDLKNIFYRAAVATTIPMLIIGIAAIFGWLLTINNFPVFVGNALHGITQDPNVFALIIVAFLLFIGLFMESNAALIIMVPVLAPMAASFGFDPVHFGVLTVVTLLIGAVTPPVGILLFISTSLAKAKVGEVMRLVWPYVLLLSILTVIISLVPALVTWLPNLIMG